jgi:hypothetical protein
MGSMGSMEEVSKTHLFFGKFIAQANSSLAQADVHIA